MFGHFSLHSQSYKKPNLYRNMLCSMECERNKIREKSQKVKPT